MRYNARMHAGCNQALANGKRFVACLALLAAACSPIVDNRGHSLQALDLTQITIGSSNHEEVEKTLGSPSAKSDFGGDNWYYISNQKERIGFFSPDITKQQVVQISFDSTGTVSDISRYEKEDGKEVVLVEKSTPSAGHSLTFMEQLLGNFGKFAAPGRQINPSRPY